MEADVFGFQLCKGVYVAMFSRVPASDLSVADGFARVCRPCTSRHRGRPDVQGQAGREQELMKLPDGLASIAVVDQAVKCDEAPDIWQLWYDYASSTSVRTRRMPRFQFVSATLVFGWFRCDAISSSSCCQTSLGVL